MDNPKDKTNLNIKTKINTNTNNISKSEVKNKKNIPFIVITSLLGVSILIPLVLLIVSTS